jgi:hypothetical protein
MHFAILWLDTSRRLRIFNDGTMNREEYVADAITSLDPGWCLKADDDEPWMDEREAIKELVSVLNARLGEPKHVAS